MMDQFVPLALSPVQEFYHGKSIFITGATGFVGKTIVEKLLRTCPSLDRIYVLLRPKKNLNVTQRLDKLVQSSIFDTVRKLNPSFHHKIIPIGGDITLPALGISIQDQSILQEDVQVVFHSAATVKFNELLKVAMEINFHGTRKMIELCKGMRQLCAFIHISTAYTNPERSEVDEIVYPLMNSLEINKLVLDMEMMDEKTMESMTSLILKEKPNTYAFTKALAENYLEQHKNVIPVSIVRPSIVTATVREPVEGWIDNVNAASGLIVFAGKGVLRSLLVNGKKRIDFIPVDYLANLTIVSGWKTAATRSTFGTPGIPVPESTISVYNCCAKNPILYNDFRRFALSAVIKNPFDDVVWYPSMQFVQSPWIHWISDLLYHRLPAYAIDLTCMTSHKKVCMSMTQVYYKIRDSISALEYFMTREWKFHTNNVHKLYGQLSPLDQLLFPMFVKELKWPEYLTNYAIGLRKYTLREDDQNCQAARQNMKRKFYQQQSLKIISFAFPSFCSYISCYC